MNTMSQDEYYHSIISQSSLINTPQSSYTPQLQYTSYSEYTYNNSNFNPVPPTPHIPIYNNSVKPQYNTDVGPIGSYFDSSPLTPHVQISNNTTCNSISDNSIKPQYNTQIASKHNVEDDEDNYYKYGDSKINNNMGVVHLTVSDPTYFKACMTCMGTIIDIAMLQFIDKYLVMCHKNDDKCVYAAMILEANKLLKYYIYRPKEQVKSDILAIGSINTHEMELTCKGNKKSEDFSLLGVISETGWLETLKPLEIKMRGTNSNMCAQVSLESYIAYSSRADFYYKDELPSAKATNDWFIKIIDQSKLYKHSIISFICTTEGILINGGAHGERSRYAFEISSDLDDKSCCDKYNEIVNTITISFTTHKKLLQNMFKTSHARAVSRIYLKQGSPLIIHVDVGNGGYMEYVLWNKD